MTSKEFREKYPIGTKIKYVGCGGNGEDVSKVGKIVGYNLYNDPIIYLPTSNHISYYSTKTVPASWECIWNSIEILPQKNQQLLFDFAY